MPISVHEVTMAAPDIVRVEVRSAPYIKGHIQTLGATDTGPGTYPITNVVNNGSGLIRITCGGGALFYDSYDHFYLTVADVTGTTEANGAWRQIYVNGTTLDMAQSVFTNTWTGGGRLIYNNFWQSGTNPLTGLAGHSMNIGPVGKHRRWSDKVPSEYLDQAAAVVHGNYGTIGGLTVTKASIKTQSYDCGFQGGAYHQRGLAMRYDIYLKLSGNLSEGSHTIDFPAGTGLNDYNFTFDDSVTRCSSLHVNHLGYRPGDGEKSGRLSHWIPEMGTHGAIEFATAYSISDYSLINDAGTQVHTGTITFKVDYNDLETGNTLTFVPRIASTTTTPLTITNISKANPGVVTYTGADPTTGQQIYIGDHYGMEQIDFVLGNGNGYWKVGTVDGGAKTFTIKTQADANLDTTTFGTYSSGGKVYFTEVVNQGCTYIYKIDFSAFQPAASNSRYRIKIAGLGVSDPFWIDDAVWWQAAKIYGAGEYSQRSGTDIDGRFDYTTPSSLDPRSSIKTFNSYLMAPFSSEAGGVGASGIQDAGTGANETWRKPDGQITNVWGGWKDAGDWDSFLQSHTYSSWHMFDTWMLLPTAIRSLSWGTPKSSAVRDPTTFAGTDNAGDLFHAAMWHMDFYRQLQLPSGGIRGGHQFTRWGVPEPSWFCKAPFYLYDADHYSTFIGAAGFAKASQACTLGGYTSLATLFYDAAIDAWDWAENLYGSQSARDTHYLDMKTKAGWSQGTYDANMTAMQNTCRDSSRPWAAASLMRMTGTVGGTWQAIVDAEWDAFWSGYAAEMLAMWEYVNTPGVNATHKTEMEAAIINRAKTAICNSYEGTIGYAPMHYTDLTWQFGEGGTTWSTIFNNVIYAYILDGNHARYKKTMQAGLGYILGCNQTGKSYTTGIGPRPVGNALHEDIACSAAAYPKGLSIYGPHPVTQPWYSNNFNINFHGQYAENDNLYTAEYKDKHHLNPPRGCWPVYESMFEATYMIEMMEYTVSQTIIPYLCSTMFLHGMDGNTKLELGDGTAIKGRLFGLQF